jgi:hypothetical protein
VPLAVVAAAQLAWQEEVSSGLLVAVAVDGVPGLALEEVSTAEDAVADELLGLAGEGRLAMAYGAPHSDSALVVGNVHRLSLEEVAAALQGVGDGVHVVLAGDPDALGGSTPGAVLRDVAAAGIVGLHDGREPTHDALGRVVAGLRRGELVTPDSVDRGFVVVACADDAEVVHRAGQLVVTSVPRTFGLSASDIAVLTPLRRGAAGARRLTEALPGVAVMTVHEAAAAARTWPAMILCLPGEAAGVLSRALLVSAFLAAERHVSVVTAARGDLGVAVAQIPHRPVRRTRLAALIRAGAG